MTNKSDAIIEAHKASRANGKGFAFAIGAPPNANFPKGHWYVDTRKPLLRDRNWTVIECSDGKEVLA